MRQVDERQRVAALSRGPVPHESGAVLVVIPCLNEEQHITDVIGSLLQATEHLELKLVVADGGSTDRSREIVAKITELDHRVILIDNPKRIQSAAINEAVRQHGETARFLIRADAHAHYPEGFCVRLLATQIATGADSVVVTMDTKGDGCLQRAAAAAQNSLLGNGGSSHRNTSRGRWVDHGHHALMMISSFRAVGGYDETFSHNEDAELDARLRQAGYRIYLTGEAPVTYYPRGTFAALFRQYFNIGRGRTRTLLRHRRSAKLRHLVLVVVAPAVLLLLLAPSAPILAVPALAWAALCIGYGLLLGLQAGDRCVAAAGIAAMATQAGWSFGFLFQLVASPLRKIVSSVSGTGKRLAALRGPNQAAP